MNAVPNYKKQVNEAIVSRRRIGKQFANATINSKDQPFFVYCLDICSHSSFEIIGVL
jgi:hypothetical protein